MSSSYDLLSYSPCLLDILAHISPGDVLSCRLVSRRLNVVIQSNPTRMPRPLATMDMRTRFAENGLPCSIIIQLRDEKKRWDCCWLRPDKTGFGQWDHKHEMKKYHEDNEIAMLPRANAVTPNGMRYYYPSTSIEDGLRRLIRFFFQRYHFSLIAFFESGYEDRTESCYRIVANELINCRTKCHQFHMDITPRPNTYSQFIGTQHTWIVAEHFWADEVMEVISRWSTVVDIQVTPRSFASFTTFLNFFKAWHSGGYGIVKSMGICQKKEDGPFKWTSREVVAMLKCSECIAVKEEERHGIADYFVEIYLRGQEEGRVLGIRYSQMESTLIAEEVVGYTGEDDQLRITRKAVTYKHIGRRFH